MTLRLGGSLSSQSYCHWYS